jgi:hypothetical protein
VIQNRKVQARELNHWIHFLSGKDSDYNFLNMLKKLSLPEKRDVRAQLARHLTDWTVRWTDLNDSRSIYVSCVDCSPEGSRPRNAEQDHTIDCAE